MSADEAREEVVERVSRAIWESYWPDRDPRWVRAQWEANAVFVGDHVQRVPRILAGIAVPIAFDAGRKYEQEQPKEDLTRESAEYPSEASWSEDDPLDSAKADLNAQWPASRAFEAGWFARGKYEQRLAAERETCGALICGLICVGPRGHTTGHTLIAACARVRSLD